MLALVTSSLFDETAADSDSAYSEEDDLADLKWEVTVPPPPLRQLVASTKFDPKWIKYMYAKFKNECPNGRMREPEFRRVLGALVPEKKKGDDYFARLFRAFAHDASYVTFQSLLECLAHLQENSPESDARWTVKLIAARNDEQFSFQEFYSFAQSVFALRDSRRVESDNQNRESVHQRATTIFRQLDADNDGMVTREDLEHFFQRNGCCAWKCSERSPRVLDF